MSSTPTLDDVAALRAAVADVGARLTGHAAELPVDDLFELVGALQGLVNAAEGAQLVAVAHAASHETRLTDRGPVEVHHGVGFVDAMAPTEVSLATGVGQWAAGRRVGLAAALGERFPRLLSAVIEGGIGASTAQKVVATCDGLDAEACATIEALLVDRLANLDPSRVTTLTRRIATRVAADQVREAQRKNRRDRCVQVSPGPDGTTQWWAQLPTDRSAAAWAAIRDLAERYAEADPSLTTDQARGDAFLDLLLTNVTVTAKVTLGIPVITTDQTTEPGGAPTGLRGRPVTGASRRHSGALAVASGPAHAVGGQGLGSAFSLRAALDGCELPGVGWVDADTVEVLLNTVPLEVGRALLDARTGAVLETTSSAYRPPKDVRAFVTTRDGTCRMWGCDRPAAACDLDHARPWPSGPTSPRNLAGLCRRHHRLKQRRRWAYRLDPDGTVTWTSPSGRRRTTLPEHATWPPPDPALPPPRPEPARREPALAGPPPF